jgi:hypothetical protein
MALVSGVKRKYHLVSFGIVSLVALIVIGSCLWISFAPFENRAGTYESQHALEKRKIQSPNEEGFSASESLEKVRKYLTCNVPYVFPVQIIFCERGVANLRGKCAI